MKSITDILPEVTELRHYLHQHPELGREEFHTAETIRKKLSEIGITPLPPFIGTDVVAVIEGGKGPGKNVTLRADIDALAIEEKTGLPYASVNPGKMHACGHDGHAAMLFGAAMLLNERRNEFAGTVRFIWQPGEENIHLGKDLVAAGALENPSADWVAAIHGMPKLPLGQLGVRSGASEGSCLHFSITVHGQGGHSSRPQRAIDPVVCAAALVLELQTIVSRRIDPLESAVLSVCTIHGGTLGNIIPNEVTLTGTARSFSDRNDMILKQGILDMANAVCSAHRTSCEVTFDSHYPVCYNTPAATDLARRVIVEHIGKEFLFEREQPSMGADDFAFYTQRHEGTYIKLGLGDVSNIHTDTFDFPDAALENGIAFFTRFALSGLQA